MDDTMDAAVTASDMITGAPANPVRNAQDVDFTEFAPGPVKDVAEATVSAGGAFFYAPINGKVYLVTVTESDWAVDDYDAYMNVVMAAMERNRPV